MAEIAEEIVCNVREDLLGKHPSPLTSSDYDLPLHIASIFILVGASILGSLSPVLFASFGSGMNKASPNSKFLLRLGLLFGAGMINNNNKKESFSVRGSSTCSSRLFSS
jgi:hypothetical protein